MNFLTPLWGVFFAPVLSCDRWSQLTLKLLHTSDFSYSHDTSFHKEMEPFSHP